MPVAQALNEIHDRIANAALRVGRRPADVTLIAVSKTFPASAVLEAVAAGQHDFGENRVEEALEKKEEVKRQKAESDDVRWHLIGHLQSRKAKEAVGQFDCIHSVDSLKLAEILSRRAGTYLLPITNNLLLQCNVSGEASKEGFDLANWEAQPAKLQAFVDAVEKMLVLPTIHINGLMTMAPIVDDPQQARPVFASLRCLRDALRDTLRERFPPLALPHLSMGMSDDFEAAIAEGSTMVRIGRAIFGVR